MALKKVVRSMILKRVYAWIMCCVLALGGCSKPAEAQHAPGAVTELQIVSPHGADIRREFGEAFARWHFEKYGEQVEVVWPDVGGGGTANVVKQLDAAYKNGPSSGYDIVFGGGSSVFNAYARSGFLAPVPGQSGSWKWETDPVQVVPAAVAGSPLHGKDKDGREVWVAATGATFGICYNKDRVNELALPVPQRWEDIAQPAWFGNISLADPSKSGSVKTSYEMIFQQYGWEKGWAVITQLFENAAIVRENGSAPPDDVGSADAVAGICIDFYGRLQALRVGTGIVDFAVPEGGTIVDADPIALLKGAPHEAIAARFIRFVVSPEGQRLWILRPGTPGGPRKSALGRMSILPSLYESDRDYLFNASNPYASGQWLTYKAALADKRNTYLGDLIKAALVDNQAALVRVRKALRRAGDPAELLAKLCALPAYRPARVIDGALQFDDWKTMSEADLGAVAGQYAPRKGEALEPFGERLATTLKDDWRESFGERFRGLEKEAEALASRR